MSCCLQNHSRTARRHLCRRAIKSFCIRISRLLVRLWWATWTGLGIITCRWLHASMVRAGLDPDHITPKATTRYMEAQSIRYNNRWETGKSTVNQICTSLASRSKRYLSFSPSFILDSKRKNYSTCHWEKVSRTNLKNFKAARGLITAPK